jgi:hypothetical protein
MENNEFVAALAETLTDATTAVLPLVNTQFDLSVALLRRLPARDRARIQQALRRAKARSKSDIEIAALTRASRAIRKPLSR